MKLTSIKKALMILSIAPLFSLASLYAAPTDLVARGEELRGGERAGERGEGGARTIQHPAAAHQEFNQRGGLNHGMENGALENRAGFNRGVEAGAVGGAAINGAGNNGGAPVYVAPQPQVQYVVPQ